jgi:ferredoxin-thioredoxin reductase catalytic chain
MQNEIDSLYETLKTDAEQAGYLITKDIEFAKELIAGLIANRKRYGYIACPCRIASGKPDDDRDIVCPCDYRDDDLVEFGQCFCGLYVVEGKIPTGSIPERRVPPNLKTDSAGSGREQITALTHPVWRCKVCGYLCARDNPPPVCPICKAKSDRFERFM